MAPGTRSRSSQAGRLRHNGDGPDGAPARCAAPGGPSYGHGKVVEAKGKAYGVVESAFKTANWQAAGLIRQLHTDGAVQAWVGLEINGKTVEGANVYTDADRGYAIGKLGPIAAAIGVPDGGYPDIPMPVAALLRSHGYTVDWKPKQGPKGTVVASRA